MSVYEVHQKKTIP